MKSTAREVWRRTGRHRVARSSATSTTIDDRSQGNGRRILLIVSLTDSSISNVMVVEFGAQFLMPFHSSFSFSILQRWKSYQKEGTQLYVLVLARFIDVSRYFSRDLYRDTLCKNRDTYRTTFNYHCFAMDHVLRLKWNFYYYYY